MENVQPKKDLHLQVGLEEASTIFIQKTHLIVQIMRKQVFDVVTIFAWTSVYIFLFL